MEGYFLGGNLQGKFYTGILTKSLNGILFFLSHFLFGDPILPVELFSRNGPGE